MLCATCSPERLQSLLIPTDSWKPFPPAADRGAWETLLQAPLNQARRDAVFKLAEEYLATPWPLLPAALAMDFGRTGNRMHFEKPYFARRQRLGIYVLAECFEHQGRFLDAIADALWAISEETAWSIPAHLPNISKELLPPAGQGLVDLFAAETAHVLAEACFLLGAELDGVTPVIRQRIHQEIRQRVIEPVETREFGWFSGENNWAPWCASNVLGAAFYTLDDASRIAALTHRLLKVNDRFLAHQSPDGGCDEGPMYWGVAGGALLIFLELLHSRSGGAISFYAEPLIREMGAYFAKVHLEGPWFAAFADAAARMQPRLPIVYRYGARTGSEPLRALALLAERQWDSAAAPTPVLSQGMCGGDLSSNLRELFWMPADNGPITPPARPADNWLPNLEVLVARTDAGPAPRGFTLAAKGGHNGENHNHNDIGQFILLFNGEPVIVDAGRGVYTRDTFSPRRYEAWFIRGSGHNAPVIGGVEQQAGANYAAAEVVHTATPAESRLALRLDGAYPEPAGLEQLRREITLRRTPEPAVIVEDRYVLRGAPRPVALNLLTPCAATSPEPGRVLLETGQGNVELCFPPEALELSQEDVVLTDEALQYAWGPHLTRLLFTQRAEGLKGAYALTFREGTQRIP